MKLDAVRAALREVLEGFYQNRSRRIDPDLIEDTLWFLDFLRKREGYDVERPVRRERQSYEDPFSYNPFSSGWQEEMAQEFRKRKERMWEEAFRWGFDEKFGKRSDQYRQSPPPQSGTARPWYEVLGVRPDATLAQKQKAYRSLAMRYHPDRAGGSTSKMQELNQAKKEAGI